MPRAIFQHPDGTREEIDVPLGVSLMQAATQNGIEGIIGECGGGMTCASCHVFVDDKFMSVVPPISLAEDQSLDFTAAPREHNSRFSCQLMMTQAMDGIEVRIADPQM